MSDYVCDHSILVRHPDQPDETCIYCGKKIPVSAPPIRKVWITNERVFASKDAALRYAMDTLESALKGESEAELKELAELSVREFEVLNDY